MPFALRRGCALFMLAFIFMGTAWFQESTRRRYAFTAMTSVEFVSRKRPPIICPPSHNVSCPRQSDYRMSCNDAWWEQRNETSQERQLPISPDGVSEHDILLLQSLRRAFQNERVAMVGDSLMRQWFETLTCRLQLPLNWYTPTSEPRKLKVAREDFGISFARMRAAPRGMEGALGYSTASTTTSQAKPSRVRVATTQQQLSIGDVGVSIDERNQCDVPFQTTLEYYHLDRLSHLGGPDDASSARRLIKFLFQEATIVIFNLGVHYGRVKNEVSDDVVLVRDILDLARACKEIRRFDRKRRCLFRESFPQHWVPAKGVSNHYTTAGFPPGWKFNISQVDRDKCGAFDVNVNTGVFSNENRKKLEAELKEVGPDVGIVRVQDMWKNAWDWHTPGDCTHFCQDVRLWDMAHKRLLEALGSQEKDGTK